MKRLRKISRWFDINLEFKNGIGYLSNSSGGPPLSLSPDASHVRLLAEVCERTLRWISYSRLESCDVTLLRLSDKQLKRVALLRRAHLAVCRDHGLDENW
jgi:hypothetical protein